MTALLLNAAGETEAAKPPARRALAAAARERSNAAKHRTLGLVGNAHREMRHELAAIVGGQPLPKPASGDRSLRAKLRGVARKIFGSDG